MCFIISHVYMRATPSVMRRRKEGLSPLRNAEALAVRDTRTRLRRPWAVRARHDTGGARHDGAALVKLHVDVIQRDGSADSPCT